VANTLMLLIRASAMVTVYRGHRRTLLLARVNSLFIMHTGIIRINSLVGGRVSRPLSASCSTAHGARVL